MPRHAAPGAALFVAVALLAALGSRPLNEPDEGRYASIALAMLDDGDAVTPRFWGLPHLDKPPLAYWAVAASLAVFGRNEWAVRLPQALAAAAAAAAAARLARDLAGPAAARWAPVLLVTSLLTAVLARMLTPDLLLTASVAWTALAAWRLRRAPADPADVRRRPSPIAWIGAGAVSLGAGILAKGPAAALPLLPCLWIAAGEPAGRRRWLASLAALTVAGVALALPWFLAVHAREPQALRYLILNRALGHTLGTTVPQRHGGLLYYVPILAAGLLPWTAWVLAAARPGWRQELPPDRRPGARFLIAWICVTLAVFTLVRAKLPAYIAPMFPPAAILAAWRWFEPCRDAATPRWLELSPFALAAAGWIAAPAALGAVYHAPVGLWIAWHAAAALLAAAALGASGLWRRRGAAAAAAALLAAGNVVSVSLASRLYDTRLRGNQTLAPLAASLNDAVGPKDRIILWGRLPQGLLFYARAARERASGIWMGGMPTNRVPFEFPGNLERLGDRWLPSEEALQRAVSAPGRAVVVSFTGALPARLGAPSGPLRLLLQSGQWELWGTDGRADPAR